jgi:hypothetical protein
MTAIARATSSGGARSLRAAFMTTPSPSGLVSTSACPGRAPAFVSMRAGWTVPVTASPNFSSGSASVWPPTRTAPASSTAAALPSRMARRWTLSSPSLGKARDVQARQGAAPHRIDIADRVRRGDPAEGPRVVHDGRDDVHRLDERQIVTKAIDSRIVRQIEPDEQVRVVTRFRGEPLRDDPQVRRTELGRSTARFGELREADLLDL